MFKEFRTLMNNKDTPQGKIDITVFYINLFLLLCHLFLMGLYVYIKHPTMIILNIISLYTYLSFIFRAYKMVDAYMTVAFFEIWIHMAAAVLSFGWEPGFQNWTFALLCAFFLPLFSPVNKREKDRRPIMIGLLFAFTYFILLFLIKTFNIPIIYQLSDRLNLILFVFNSIIAFITIIVFTYFYTTRSYKRQNELSRRADYDELTSLYNRYSLNYIGNSIIQQSGMVNKPFSVAIIDIDHFKKINDTYGHAVGDEVLKELSKYLRAYSIRGITPGRWGGEEFIMIAPNGIEFQEFVIILEKLRERMESKHISVNKKDIQITISIGVASVKKVKSIEEAVAIADKKLYEAKETGRNKVVY